MMIFSHAQAERTQKIYTYFFPFIWTATTKSRGEWERDKDNANKKKTEKIS